MTMATRVEVTIGSAAEWTVRDVVDNGYLRGVDSFTVVGGVGYWRGESEQQRTFMLYGDYDLCARFVAGLVAFGADIGEECVLVASYDANAELWDAFGIVEVL
jgi:hypothetical protein